MEDVILFVQDNYVWFIVIGVLLVMAIIGYYADKTDFGRQDKVRQPKVKKSKKQKMKKEPEVDPAIEEATSSNPSINDILGSFTPTQEQSEETVEPVFHPIEDTSSMDVPVEQEADDEEIEELEPVKLEESFEPNISEEQIEPVAPVEPIQEDLYVGLDGTPNVYSTPIPEAKELAEENDEDVWKF